MPRKRYQVVTDVPYHVWARCINREWFQIPMDEVWSIFSEQLYFIKHAYNLKILSFVLMNNHYHLLVVTPDGNLAEAMNYFQTQVSKEIGRRLNRINQIFGGPYGWSIVGGQRYYLCAYRYNYRNPIDAGIANLVEEYRYSTLHGLLGFSQLVIPVERDETLFSDVEGTIRWLNTEYKSTELREAIGRALKRREFKIPKRFENDF